MRKFVLGCVVAAVVSSSLIGPTPAAIAQGAAGAGEQSRGEKLERSAGEIVANIEKHKSELDRLGEKIAGASNEDRRALRERAIELAGEYMVDLEDLAANVVEREALGLDVSADRDLVADLARRTLQMIRQSIDSTQDQLKTLRGSKDGAAGGELEEIDRELEVKNAWLDRVLDLHLDLTLTMEEFGLDVAAERRFLTDTLTERAELVAGRILLGKESIAKIQGRLKIDPANVDVNAELDRASSRQDFFIERLTTTTRMMEALDLDTAEYQQMLFEVTGEITTGLFSREVLAGIFKGWVGSTVDWIGHNGPTIILKVFLFVLILVVFRILSRIARRIVSRAIRSSSLEFSTLLERTALSLTGSVVMMFGLLVALSQLGFEVGPLLAGLGVAGFIVGFALQDTLSNFASGVMILLYRPYDVGDLVETAGAFGKVENMTLVSTTILTLDHQTLVIPNSMIWGDVIKNVTAQTKRRVDMTFGIGYADDIPKAEKVLTEIVAAHEKVLDDPAPMVKLHNLGDSSVDFIVRPWVATDDYWNVYWDITREVKMRFDAEGISIPFPQRDVHLFREDGDEA